MNKFDLRVIKTKKTLYNSLIELMKEKSFEEIKVSDICNHALINRSTFYAHYEDKYDLFSDYINDLKISLTNELKKNQNIASTKEYYIEMIKLFFNHIEQNKDNYLATIINNRNSIIIDILYDVIDKDIINHLETNDKNVNNVPNNIIAQFYLGAVVSVSINWLKNINKYTKDDMLNYLTILIPNDIN